ncbi:MAG: cysteine--tRNA ligase [Candidatus Thorarchaeota archaeon]
MLKVYNTLSRDKEAFEPLEDNEVRMYVCGPTVYDYPHIGNARSFVVFDTIRRYLDFKGYRVFYVTNFTDIDDKMINRANEEGIAVPELAERFITEYRKIERELNVKPADRNPRATEHIQDMIEMVENILENGKAYEVDGDVYFNVSEFENYGTLSKISPEELDSGARVEIDAKKKDARDFALWKAQKPGEPAWDSPWGKGRPGWHLECSVMGKHFLGVPFDIHGGGQDLIFPHHENEIAQTAAAYDVGQPIKYWLHNGMLTIDEEKMSKSEGNFFTSREVLDAYDAQAVRLFLVSGHYRHPLDYNQEALEQATTSIERLRNVAERLRGRMQIIRQKDFKPSEADATLEESIDQVREGFEREMDDDFNTPGALAEIFSFVKEINTVIDDVGNPATLRDALGVLKERLMVLGIDLERGKTELSVTGQSELVGKLIDFVLSIREKAREEQDYETADKIRDGLADLGIEVKDTKDGPTWRMN